MFGRVLAALAAVDSAEGAEKVTGPTLCLGSGPGEPLSNSVASFMYFIPLISPEPVSEVSSPGSTQSTRITSVTRRQSANSFKTTCDFEFAGLGSQQSIFDLTRQIDRHKPQLRAGGVLGRQLRSITVTGSGSGRVEVEGTVTNGTQMVAQVRMHFNAKGQPSPVSIGLCDVRYVGGDFRSVNEIIASVNTLTFRRKTGTPKMEVTVASVKNKGAGNGLWQNLKGSLKGAAVNLVIAPLRIDPVGQQAMLDFGQALAAGAASFTFPQARNLKQNQTQSNFSEGKVSAIPRNSGALHHDYIPYAPS